MRKLAVSTPCGQDDKVFEDSTDAES